MSTALKWTVGIGLIAAVAFVGVGAVAAQEDTPPGPFGPGFAGKGLLADYADVIHEAVADALGITVDELDAAKEDGVRLYELAEDKGVELETVRQAMDDARAEAIAAALADGVITDEQAEWLAEHPHPGGRGTGRGDCDGDGPMGRGRFGGFGGGAGSDS